MQYSGSQKPDVEQQKEVIEHIYYDSIYMQLVNSKNKIISYMGVHVYGHTICNEEWKRK